MPLKRDIPTKDAAACRALSGRQRDLAQTHRYRYRPCPPPKLPRAGVRPGPLFITFARSPLARAAQCHSARSSNPPPAPRASPSSRARPHSPRASRLWDPLQPPRHTLTTFPLHLLCLQPVTDPEPHQGSSTISASSCLRSLGAPLWRVLCDLPPSSHLEGPNDPCNLRRAPNAPRLVICTAAASPLLPAGTQVPSPPGPPAPAKDEKAGPAGSVLPPGPSLPPAGARVPAHPAPFSLTGLLPGGPRSSSPPALRAGPAAPLPQLRPGRTAPPAPRSPPHGGRASAGGARGTARGRRAGRPGLGLRAAGLQPGSTAPTLRRRPRDGDAATPTARPRDPSPPTRLAPGPLQRPAVWAAKRPHQLPRRSAPARYLQGPRTVLGAAETPLSRRPAAPRPASALSLGPCLSIKPGAKPGRWSFLGCT